MVICLKEKDIYKLHEKEYWSNEPEDLMEMSTLRKKDTNLPVNIYVDDSGSYKNSGHAKRIKFQPDKVDHPKTRKMIPMSISDNPQVLVRNAKIDLSAKEIDKIRAFVIANKDILNALSDMEISIFEFGRLMVKV